MPTRAMDAAPAARNAAASLARGPAGVVDTALGVRVYDAHSVGLIARLRYPLSCLTVV
jgi:hypothetical protein